MKKKVCLILLAIFILCFALITVYIYIDHHIADQNKKISFSSDDYNSILTKKEVAWLKSREAIIYAADRNAPPLRFVDKSDNQYKGVVIDYVNLLSLELGIKIEMHPLLWEDALSSLSQGKSDICDMFESEERAKHYLFTKPFYTLRAVTAIRVEDSTDERMNHLNDLKIAVQKGDYVNEYLKKYHPKAELVMVADIYEALCLLAQGEVDAVIGDEPVVLYQIDKNNFGDTIKITGEPLYEEEVVFAIPKSELQLVSIMNKGIDSLDKKGQMEKIQQKWFGISTPIAKQYLLSKLKKYTALSVMTAISILIVMLVLYFSLKRVVKLRTKELEDSRNDIQIVFDGITEYMLVVDKKKTIVNVNRSFLDFLGKTKQETVGYPCNKFLRAFCSDCDNCMIESAFTALSSYEKEVCSKNEFYMVKTFPLMSTDSVIKNVLVVISNITSEKISKNQMMQANKMAAIGQLAAGVAHEIRNPLGIVRNHTFILRNTYDSNPEIVKSLDDIDASVESASKIISNLLNLSRISEDSREWISIKTFIYSIFELRNKYMQKNIIEYIINCDDDLRCLMNQESLKHILLNLISNAIDAINSNGKITIDAYSKDQGLIIECADTGCGIPQNNLDNIFNPFFTTKDFGEGIGLGLYIVYNEVKKLNGDITVDSEINRGTSFKIFLPIEVGV